MAEPSVCPKCLRPIWFIGEHAGTCVEAAGYLRSGFPGAVPCNDLHIARLEAVIAATKAAVERAKAARAEDDMDDPTLDELIAELESVK